MAEQPEMPPERPATPGGAAGRTETTGRQATPGKRAPEESASGNTTPGQPQMPYGTVRIVDLPESDQKFMRNALRHDTPLHDLLGLEIAEIGEEHAVLSMP